MKYSLFSILKLVPLMCTIFLGTINYSYSTEYCSQNNYDSLATISVKVPGKRSIVLYRLDRHYADSPLFFSNYSDHDSVISNTVKINNSQEFAIRTIIQGKGIQHSFILRGGDSVSFNVSPEFDLKEENRQKDLVFLDSWFEIYDDWKTTKSYRDFNSSDFKSYYLSVEEVYQKNLKRLDSLSKQKLISSEKFLDWKTALDIDYTIRLLSPISYNFPYNSILDPYLVPRIEVLIKEMSQWRDIKSPRINTLLFYISKFKAAHSPQEDREWASSVDRDFIEGPLKNYSIAFLVGKLKQHPIKASKDFDTAFQILKEKAGTSYTDYIDSIYAESKVVSLKNIDQIYLQDVSNNKTTLSKVMSEGKKDFILIDFWASWCKPCRAQKPAWHNAKRRFEGKNVLFLSISLDRDDKEAAWIQALKADKTFAENNELKLVNPPKSKLFNSLQIPSIPRYIIISNRGAIIHENFPVPGSPEFTRQLDSIIKAGKKI